MDNPKSEISQKSENGLEQSSINSLDKLQQGALVVAENGKVKFANAAFRELTGLHNSEIVEDDFLTELFDSIISNQILERLQARSSFEILVEIKNAEARNITCKITLIPAFQAEANTLPLSLILFAQPNEIEKDLMESLERKNRQYELAIKGTRNGLWDWNLETNEAFYSSQWFEMLGYSPNDLPSTLQSFYDQLHPEDYFRVIRTINSYITREILEYDVEFRLRQKDGSYKWIHGRGEVLFNKENNPYRFIGFNRDITEKKLAEQIVAAKEREYSNLINSLQEVIFKTDIYGRFTLLNPFWKQLMGFNEENSLGEDLVEYFHPTEAENKSGIVKEIISGVRKMEFQQVRMVTREGKVIWVELFIRPEIDEESRAPKGTYGSIKDISEQRYAQLALQESEKKRDEVLSSIDDVVWSYNVIKKESTFFGNSLERIFGYKEKDFNENPSLWYQIAHPDDRKIAKSASENTLKGTPESEVVYRIVRKNGDVRWIRVRSRISHLSSKEVHRIDGTVADITEMKRAELALIEQEKEYRKVVTSLSEAIIKFDDKGKIIFTNPAWKKLTGYKSETARGKNFFDFVYEEDLDIALELWNNTQKKEGETINGELRLKHKTNNFRWVELFLQQSNEDGDQSYFGSIVDIHDKLQANQKLIESEKKFRFLSENLNDILLLLDNDGKFLYVSPSIKNLGFSSIELKEKTIFDLVQKDSVESFKLKFENAIKANIKSLAEVKFLKKGKDTRWYETLLHPVTNKLGQVIQIQVSARDITDRIKIRQDLEESENRFRTIAETLPIPVMITESGDNQIVYVNQALIGHYQYKSQKELYGKPLLKFFKYKKELREHKALIADGGSLNGVEYQTVDKLGNVRWVSVFVRPIQYEGKSCHIMVFYDISDRKKAESLLRESEEKYRMISENISDMVCIHNPEGEFTYISPSMVELLGYDPEEWEGKMPYGLLVGKDEKKYLDSIDPAFLLQKEMISQRLKFKTKTGQSLWFETVSKPVFNLEMELVGIQTVSRNVMNFVEAEREMKKALDKEKELNELKSRFVTMASHEFRTPLTAIRSSIELLSIYSENTELAVREKLMRHYEKIIKETKRLTSLMNDILILGKAEAGKTPFEPEDVNIEELCYQVLELYENQEAERKVEFSIDGPCKSFWIDPELMNPVISNLVSNALKYSKNKPAPRLEVLVDEDNLIIKVQDFGIGIPSDELSQLYKSFFRARNVTNIQGTGLGLVIVKQLVDLHKGKIFVDSVLGEGTIFTIEIPNRK